VCFGSEQEGWVHKAIDSRDCTLPNKELLAEWIETYGVDSDFVRVRVRGLRPTADELQFIDRETHQAADLEGIKAFEMTNEFFSSPEVRKFAEGGPALELPQGQTASEKRGRWFFEDVVDFADLKHGSCAACHAGPMLNQTNLFTYLVFGIPVGTRFQDILVSELNVAGNPVQEFIFNKGLVNERHVFSPDIGRSAITGVTDLEDATQGIKFSNFNAFKIPQLRGVRDTGPYFHDNSAKTLEDVMIHYTKFFAFVTNGGLMLTPQDQADVVAFMKLLR
jgi:cytochrome c peroxidase